jgi:long-chain acyl-CoA synthetase
LDRKQYTYDISMFKETFEYEFTYMNGFLRNVRRFGNSTALICPLKDKSWTYIELNKDVNKLAHALLEDGIGKDDVVTYQLLNSVEFIHCFLSPQKIGAINNPINFRLSPGETAYIIDDSKPAVFIYDAELKEDVVKALALAKHQPKRIIMVDAFRDAVALPEGHISFTEYVKGKSVENPKIERPKHIYDENTRLYTSGTTGMPKGIPLNNINDVLSAHDVIMHFPLNPTDITMNMSPWFHRGGLHSGGPVPVLYVGGQIIILRRFSPKTTIKYIEKYKINFITGAPTMLKMLHDEMQKHPADLSSLKGIITMGAPFEKEDCIKYMKDLSPNIFNGYGTTEAFWNTFLRPFDLPHMSGADGRSCTDDDVAVVKIYEDRKAEPDDFVAKDNQEVGEIIVRAPAKSAYAYINNEKEAERVFYKGWIYIGDLGTWDENEFITVAGRKNDMIISSGENIYPIQIEEILNQHPKVQESVVVSVPDKLRGEAVVAYILKADPSLTAKELSNFCFKHPRMSKYKKPRFFRFVKEFPYTATGKKKHYEVRKMALEDQKNGKLER